MLDRERLPALAVPLLSAIALLAMTGARAQPATAVPANRPGLVAPSATTTSVDRVLPYEVTVNGAKQGSWLLLEHEGNFYAPLDAFEEWRLQAGASDKGVVYRGTTYLPLYTIPGFSSKVNAATQSIELNFSPQAFAGLRLSTEIAKRPPLAPVMRSFFANYDLSVTGTTGRSTTTGTDVGLQTELGFSGPWGVLTSTQAGRNLLHRADSTEPGWIRLETTYTRNFPDSNRTLHVGDGSTRTGMWGRMVYFGGLQFGTNFGLTPGFQSQAYPVLTGSSAAPSTVELYVNEVLRQVSNVPSGPFVIENYSALTGTGEARMVIKDVLGRETVITQSFFTSSQLLAQGLDDWSVELGKQRIDLGTGSGHYVDPFASGLWRHGFGSRFTGEARLEFTRDTRTVGLGAVVGLPWEMLAKGAIAVSDDATRGRGHLWLLGLEHQSLRLNANLQAQGASAGFRQLGIQDATLATKLQVAGNVSYSPGGNWGTFGIGFAELDRFDSPRIVTVSANYTRMIAPRTSLTLTASHAVSGGGQSSVAVNLIAALDPTRVLSAAVTRSSSHTDGYVSATSNSGYDGGLGWRVLGGRRTGEPYSEGNLYYTGRYGRLSADMSASRSESALRLGAAGGVVVAANHAFPTRTVDDAYALVQVEGYPNVGIGLGSNVLTRTNADGVALVPRLAAYQSNAIRVDPKDLPISAELDTIEQITVPSWRSGVSVVFPVRTGRGALLRIVLDDGQPAPPGAMVRVQGDKEDFYVARRGEAFVTGLQPHNRARLTWNGAHCEFDVDLPPASPDDIPRLGPLPCKGVAR